MWGKKFFFTSRLFFCPVPVFFLQWPSPHFAFGKLNFFLVCYFFPGAFFVGPCSPRSKGGGGGGSSNFVSSSNSYWGYEESAAGEEEEESEEDNGKLFSHMEINFAPVRYIPCAPLPRWRYQHLWWNQLFNFWSSSNCPDARIKKIVRLHRLLTLKGVNLQRIKVVLRKLTIFDFPLDSLHSSFWELLCPPSTVSMSVVSSIHD